jgi:hypothetical protein
MTKPAPTKEQLASAVDRLEQDLRDVIKQARSPANLRQRGVTNRTFKQQLIDEATDGTVEERLTEGLSGSSRSSERGEIGRNAFRTLAAISGAVPGSIIGNIIQENLESGSRFRGPNESDPNWTGITLGALAGMFIGVPAALRAGNFLINRSMQNLERAAASAAIPGGRRARFFALPDTQQLPQSEVASKVGKTSTSVRDFLRFPVDQQIKHLETRLRNVSARPNISQTDKQTQIAKILTSFAPAGGTAEQFDRTASTVLATLKAAGLSDQQAFLALRGTLARAALSPRERLTARNLDIRALATNGRYLPPTPNNSIKELRDLVATADLVSGPPAQIPLGSRGAATDFGRS